MAIPSDNNRSNLGVLVGFDGSPHAVDALYWGANAATRRGRHLTVVSAYQFPYTDYLHNISIPENDPSTRIAEGRLEQAHQLLTQAQHSGHVDYKSVIGDATYSLVGLSKDADLLVVGRRGLGAFLGRLLGSVSAALPAHAACPTVVVWSTSPEVSGDVGGVCVGVDGSAGARSAAIVAAQEAKRLGVKLEVVQAQPPFTGTSTTWFLATDETVEQQIYADILGSLTAEIEFLEQQVPGVEITPVVIRQEPAKAMIECTERAQLTVLGTRGHGGFVSLLLGSVSGTTLSHASGTVMIVPKGEDQ